MTKYQMLRQSLKELAESIRKTKAAYKQCQREHQGCDGGCGGGVHRYEEMSKIPLTEEVVKLAEGNVRRLRTWFVNSNRENKVIGGATYVTFPKQASWYWKFLMWLAKFDR
jgi:hypothetical protein